MKKKHVVWLAVVVVLAASIAVAVIVSGNQKHREDRRAWDLMRDSIDGAISAEMYRATASGKDAKVHALELVSDLRSAVYSRNSMAKVDTSAVDEVVRRLGDDHAWVGFSDEQWSDIRKDVARLLRSVSDQVDHLEAGRSTDDRDFRFLREEELEKAEEILARVRSVKP